MVPDVVPLPVGDNDAVALALIVDDGVIGGAIVALNDTDDVPLAVPPKLRVLVGVIVIDIFIVVEPLSQLVGDFVPATEVDEVVLVLGVAPPPFTSITPSHNADDEFKIIPFGHVADKFAA